MPIRTALAALLLIAATSLAEAQTPTRVATFQDWSVYTYSDDSGTLCYVASQPTQALPSGVNRDPIFFTIANRPAETVFEEVSIRMGYPLDSEVNVTAQIDDEEPFVLFTRVDVASDGVWVENPAIQSALVVSMERGVNMVIRGRSQRGTDTTDTYSLRGITAALERMGEECPQS